MQGQGLLRIAGPTDMPDANEQARPPQPAQKQNQDFTGLSGYIRGQFELFKLHRNTPNSGWSDRLLAALRAFNGVYDPEKLKAIKAFGGSEVYIKLTAKKCRGASSLLRDVYLGADKPWGLIPPDDPPIPPEVMQAISQLVQYEMQVMQEQGQPFNPEDMQQRATGLLGQAREAAKKQARDKVQIAEEKVRVSDRGRLLSGAR